MQIFATNLNQNLNIQDFKFFLIHGDEILQKTESLKKIKTFFKQKKYEEIEIFEINEEKKWESFFNSYNNLNLFSTKKIIEIRIEKSINKYSQKIINEIISNIPKDLIIIVTCNKLTQSEQKAKWFLNCTKLGLTINASNITKSKFPYWIKCRLNTLGINTSNDVINLLAYYFEGNLLACSQAIDKINLHYNKNNKELLTISNIKKYISDNARFKNFDLIEPMLIGDLNKILHILKCFEEQEHDPILILWIITNEIRTLIKILHELETTKNSLEQITTKYGIWNSKIPIIKKAISKLTICKLENMLQKAANIDMIVKGITPDNSWNAIKSLCYDFCFDLEKMKER